MEIRFFFSMIGFSDDVWVRLKPYPCHLLLLIQRLCIQRFQPFQLFANFDFQSTRDGLVEIGFVQAVGHIAFAGGVSVRFVVGVAVFASVAYSFISLVGALRRWTGTSSLAFSLTKRRIWLYAL